MVSIHDPQFLVFANSGESSMVSEWLVLGLNLFVIAPSMTLEKKLR